MKNFFAIAFLGLCWASLAKGADLCVTNASDATHYFTVESLDGERMAQWLDPGATLCLDAPIDPGARVAAFDDPQSIEGCTRLLGVSGRDTLLAFANFDRCHWASQVN